MKKIVSKFLCAVAVVMVVASMALPVSAANTTDRDYYKGSIAAGSWQTTVSTSKENSTSVYVLPSQCPNGVSRMQTYTTIGSVNYNKTQFGTVYLNTGTKYGIYNLIWESGGRMAYLNMTPNNGSGVMAGQWSADSVSEAGMVYV